MKSVGKYKSTFFKAKGKWGVAGDEILAESLMELFIILSTLAFFLGAMESHCFARSRKTAWSDVLFIWTALVIMWGLLGR